MRLIDADVLAQEFQERKEADEFLWEFDSAQVYGEAIDCVNDAPTIDAVPVVHGKWLRGDEMPDYPSVPYKPWMRYCSECRAMTGQDDNALYEYCPDCGAKMDGRREDGDNNG